MLTAGAKFAIIAVFIAIGATILGVGIFLTVKDGSNSSNGNGKSPGSNPGSHSSTSSLPPAPPKPRTGGIPSGMLQFANQPEAGLAEKTGPGIVKTNEPVRMMPTCLSAFIRAHVCVKEHTV